MAASYRESFLAHSARIEGNSKSQIKHLIEESQSKITSLASQIASLTAKCEQERVYLAALQYSIAPIRTLPVELLAEIFCWVEEPERRWLNNHFKPTLRISQVCLHWRQVAQTTPRLWTCPLLISNRVPAKMSIHVYAKRLQAWLARSAPLSIPVSFETEHESSGTWEDISPILEEVLKVSSRWHSFKICDSGPLNAPFIKRLAQYPMDSLEYILEKLDDMDPPVGVYFGSTPRLRRVHLYRGILSASWSVISELILYPYGGSVKAALEIVLQCPNVVDLTVDVALWTESPAASAVVTFNHLRTISLAFTGNSDFTPFLNRISAPRLEKLSLELDTMIPWEEAEFTAF
ncbi:hypothetical protein R3P38DRAFT_1854535 [Favolaschia claudopus]|uniref:F-box domain-containing protein n=1 Tax=Favolaschia claudopus TaxID=2862362 RepID=A0AAW0DAE9_9AGAR